MALFFFGCLEKPWRTIAVLFSLQFFSHSPRCCEKIIFYPKEYFIHLIFTLSVFLFSTVQRCADCNAVRRTRRRRKRQRGGVFALAALIPALVAASKAATLGAVGGAAGYGVKKGLEAATGKKKKRR